jgi:hypothetical protein
LSALRYITIKTQARRLKYFVIAIKLLSKNGLQKQIFSNLLVDWSKENHHQFLKYKSPSGEITIPEGRVISNSLNSYIKALLELNLIIEQGNVIVPTKVSDVLNILNSQINISTKYISNVYSLNTIEKSFLFVVLFEKDYDILILIMKMISISPGEKLDFFLAEFQEKYLERLENKLSYKDINDPSAIIESKQRVSAWRSPKKYSEEYVPQRVNWLIDLGFIEVDSLNIKKFVLTRDATIFLSNLGNLELEFSLFDENWHQSHFISNMAFLFSQNESLRMWDTIPSFEKESKLDECLTIAISEFSVLGILRAPAKSTLILTALFLLNKYNIVINYIDIIKWVESNGKLKNKTYAYRGAEREGEAYFIVNYE